MKLHLAKQDQLYNFKIRFNTEYGNTNLFWRIIVGENQYLAASLDCLVFTRSDSSFDVNANSVKYHMAGDCNELFIDDNNHAVFK